jgi:sialidase-1
MIHTLRPLAALSTIIIGLTCLATTSRTAAAVTQPLLYTVPFKAGDGGYRIFRIPAIWTAPNKPLLAFAEGRVTERRAKGNIDIVLRRSHDLGQTWEPLQIVADLEADFCGNPCVVHDPSTNRLWLAFTRSPGAATEETIVARTAPPTTVWITYSDDDGATWAKPRDISASARKPTWGWYGTGPGLGVYLGDAKSGRVLIPAYHTEGETYRTHCIYSDDHGATWQLGEVAANDTSEPQMVVAHDGSLLMNARKIAGKGEQRTLVTSRDRGRTWQLATNVTPLLDQHCQGCLYRCFRSGSKDRFDLIYTQPNQRQRYGVTAWLSEDEGKTWPYAQTLWNGPSAYTAMIRAQDGLVCLLLECGTKDPYEQIAFLKLAPEWLRARPAPGER